MDVSTAGCCLGDSRRQVGTCLLLCGAWPVYLHARGAPNARRRQIEVVCVASVS